MTKEVRQFKRAIDETFKFNIAKKRFHQYTKQADLITLKVVESASCTGCYFLADVVKRGVTIGTKCKRTVSDRAVTGFCSYPLENKDKFISIFGNSFVKFVRVD